MVAAIAVKDQSDNTRMDPRFGRCSFFAIYNSDNDYLQFVTNPAQAEQHGAGTQAAQFVAEYGVDKVFAHEFGPQAHEVLVKLGIEAIKKDEGSALAEILAELRG